MEKAANDPKKAEAMKRLVAELEAGEASGDPMEQSLVEAVLQLQVDESDVLRADTICKRLGIDLPTYFRICIARLIQENGIPFSMKLEAPVESKGISAMKAASRIAEAQGIADMTLEEINAEIAAVRQ